MQMDILAQNKKRVPAFLMYLFCQSPPIDQPTNEIS